MEQNTSLYHHGIKGQRWGVRRFQNKNGTLTRAGRKRYAKDADKEKPEGITVEEAKAQVLNSRSAKMLYNNRQLFNYDEMKKQKDLLAMDAEVKKMIVEEPGKVTKFLTKAADFAKKVNDFASPTIDTLTKVHDFMDKADPAAKARKAVKEQEEIRIKKESADKLHAEKEKVDAEKATENERTRKAKAEADKAEAEAKGGMKWRKIPNPTKGKVLDNEDDSDKSSTKDTDDKKTIWDVPFEDMTPSKETVSFIYTGLLGSGSNSSSLASHKVDSLPAPSSETKAFLTENKIAGYLPGPKEDD